MIGPGEPTEVRLIGVGRFTQYFDAGTDDKDVNFTLAVTHNFSTRLSFRADIYAAYQNRAEFPIQCWSAKRARSLLRHERYFFAYYHWLPRLSTITSYTFERIQV